MRIFSLQIKYWFVVGLWGKLQDISRNAIYFREGKFFSFIISSSSCIFAKEMQSACFKTSKRIFSKSLKTTLCPLNHSLFTVYVYIVYGEINVDNHKRTNYLPWLFVYSSWCYDVEAVHLPEVQDWIVSVYLRNKHGSYKVWNFLLLYHGRHHVYQQILIFSRENDYFPENICQPKKGGNISFLI